MIIFVAKHQLLKTLISVLLYDVSLKGAAPFDKDTLLSSRKLGFGINLQKLIFDHVVHINKIFLTDALMNVQVNEKGEANYLNAINAGACNAKMLKLKVVTEVI